MEIDLVKNSNNKRSAHSFSLATILAVIATLTVGITLTGCSSSGKSSLRTTPGATMTLPRFHGGETYHYNVIGNNPDWEEMHVLTGNGSVSFAYTSTDQTKKKLPVKINAYQYKTNSMTLNYTQEADGTLRYRDAINAEGFYDQAVSEFIPSMLRPTLTVGETVPFGNGAGSYTVKGVEKIHVPAGTFEAFRVEFTGVRTRSQTPATWTDWYTADKFLVKRLQEGPGYKVLGMEFHVRTGLELRNDPPFKPAFRRRAIN